MKPRTQSILVVVWTAILAALLWHAIVGRDFVRRTYDLVLEEPESFLADPTGVTVPSPLGRMLWHGEGPFEATIGPLEPGDEVLLNLRSDCAHGAIAVSLAASSGEPTGQPGSRVRLAELHLVDEWQQHSVNVIAGGDRLVLERLTDPSCDLHLSRISARNARDYAEGVVDIYRTLDLREHEWSKGQRTLGWLVLLLPALAFSRRRLPLMKGFTPTLGLLLAGVIAMMLYQAASVWSGLRLIVTPGSFIILLIGLPLILLIAALAGRLAGRWIVQARAGFPAAWASARHRFDPLMKAATPLGRTILDHVRRPRVQLSACLALGILIWGFSLYDLAQRRWDGDLRGFPRFDAGYKLLSPLRREMPTSDGGHDGQFYAILSADPFLLKHRTEVTIDAPTFRGRRILVPMMAWVLSGFGQSRAVVTYILLTWLGAFAAIVLAGYRLLALKTSPFWLLTLIFTAGIQLSLSRAMIDAASVALVLATLFLWHRERYGASTWFTVAATMTRETSILVAPALAIDAAGKRQWRRAALVLALPAAFLTAWLIYLQETVERWEPLTGSTLGLPLAWLPRKLLLLNDLPRWLVVAEIAALLSVLLALPLAATIVARGWRLRAVPPPIELNFLAVSGLVVVLNLKVFTAVYDYSRVFLLVPFLGLLIGEAHGPGWSRRIGRAIAILAMIAGLCLMRIDFY